MMKSSKCLYLGSECPTRCLACSSKENTPGKTHRRSTGLLDALKAISHFLGEKAQGMMEYALLIACIISIAAYLIYGDNHGQAIERSIDNASETFEAADRHGNEK